MPFTTRKLLTFHTYISFDNPDFHIHTLKNRIQTHTCVLGSLFRPAPGAQEMGRPATASPYASISFYFLCRRSVSIFLSFGALDLGIINVSPNNDTLSCIFSFQFVQAFLSHNHIPRILFILDSLFIVWEYTTRVPLF